MDESKVILPGIQSKRVADDHEPETPPKIPSISSEWSAPGRKILLKDTKPGQYFRMFGATGKQQNDLIDHDGLLFRVGGKPEYGAVVSLSYPEIWWPPEYIKCWGKTVQLVEVVVSVEAL